MIEGRTPLLPPTAPPPPPRRLPHPPLCRDPHCRPSRQQQQVDALDACFECLSLCNDIDCSCCPRQQHQQQQQPCRCACGCCHELRPFGLLSAGWFVLGIFLLARTFVNQTQTITLAPFETRVVHMGPTCDRVGVTWNDITLAPEADQPSTVNIARTRPFVPLALTPPPEEHPLPSTPTTTTTSASASSTLAPQQLDLDVQQKFLVVTSTTTQTIPTLRAQHALATQLAEIDPQHFFAWRWHLKALSEVRFGVQLPSMGIPHGSARYMLVRGQDAFRAWTQHGDERGVLVSRPVLADTVHVFTSRDEDTYYWVVANTHAVAIVEGLRVSVELDTVEYNVTSFPVVCRGVPCALAPQRLILVTPNASGTLAPNATVTVSVNCGQNAARIVIILAMAISVAGMLCAHDRCGRARRS